MVNQGTNPGNGKEVSRERRTLYEYQWSSSPPGLTDFGLSCLVGDSFTNQIPTSTLGQTRLLYVRKRSPKTLRVRLYKRKE